MLSVGSLAFAAPWMLLALAALPALWWLLRVTPPAPKRVRFPAVRLLFELMRREETAARTPWWLLLLRLAVAALIILALAHPLLNPGTQLPGSGPVLLVVDDGWAAADDWRARQDAIENLLDQAERADRPVALLATAATETGQPPALTAFMPAGELRRTVAALRPKPWPADHAAALAALEGIAEGGASVFWLSDGLEHGAAGSAAALAERLQRFGRLRVVTAGAEAPVQLLKPPVNEAGALVVPVSQTPSDIEARLWLRARGADGRILHRQAFAIPAGETQASVPVDLPPELRNRLARLEIEEVDSAGAVLLLDERWRRRPVGLVSGSPTTANQPLIGDLYYLERALEPFTELRRGGILELLQRELALLILADMDVLSNQERQAIEAWIGRGGLLVRFAGPRLANNPEGLLPTKLRGGDRVLGGAMSWSQPASLAPFPAESPFHGLSVPEEVRINRQVLAEPTLDLGSKTWARLTDGTPLVTAERQGDGWLVLFHITSNRDWSDLPLSGLFVQMLRRIVELSQGVAGAEGDAVLPPFQLLDGFGRSQMPPATAIGIAATAFDRTLPSPRHPPGFYGDETVRRALNLAAGVPELRPLRGLPGGVERGQLVGGREFDFKPWLLAAALLLAALDLLISLHLRGLFRRPGAFGPAAAAVLLALLVAAPPALAQSRGANDDFAMAASLETRLAYVVTGSGTVDEVSRAGLRGLTEIVNRRTAAALAEPMAVDLERDDLAFFPLLYWPATAEQPAPSQAAIDKVNDFLKNGGIILFDTRDQGGGRGGIYGGSSGSGALRRLTQGLAVPPLAPVPNEHVLGRAFYLLHDFPGRWTGGTVWVQRDEDRANDSVSSVIIGGHDWAAAWAVDASGQHPYAVVPGGPRQRELAYRFGVNLVMYALTGNYKGDQVHVPVILERLGP